jgi:CheY-like chemotaxis protein
LNNTLNVLLAEDREDDVFLMQRAFTKSGVTSHLNVVRDGAEALAYLKGEGAFADRSKFPLPDILLLDVNMPGVDGFEVLAWVRKEPKLSRLMVHILSSSNRDGDVQRAYDLRANSYIVKPTSVDDLIAFVSAFHAMHRFVRLPEKPIYWDGRTRDFIEAARGV